VRDLFKRQWVPTGVKLPEASLHDDDVLASIIRITGGNCRLLHRLLNEGEGQQVHEGAAKDDLAEGHGQRQQRRSTDLDSMYRATGLLGRSGPALAVPRAYAPA